MLIRILANATILTGLFLLGRVFCQAAAGSLASQYPALTPGFGAQGVLTLGLGLAVPMHVMAVGLILQKQWLTPRWARMAWFAVVVSGCWLGATLLIKLFLLPSTG